MSHTQHGQAALWVALLATLCLMLPMAGTAHAEGEWEWEIEGSALKELEPAEAPILGFANPSFTLAVPFYASEIVCTELAVENGRLLTAGKSDAELQFSSCKLKGPPFVVESCKLVEPIKADVKGLLILHRTKTYIVIEPSEAEAPLATIEFKEGTGCPLPLKNTVKGSVVAETTAGESDQHLLAVNPATEELFPGHELEFGTHPATLEGEAAVDLGGAVEGQKWTVKATPHAGQFTIGGKTLPELKLEGESLAGELDEDLTFQIWNLAIEIHCKGSKGFSGALLLKGVANLSLPLTECALYMMNPLEEFSPCDVTNPMLNTSISSVSHGGKSYVTFAPLSGKFHYLSFKVEGPECPIEVEWAIGGTLSAEVEPEKTTQELKFGEPIVEEWLGTGPTFGEEEVSVTGSVSLKLGGAFKGKAWGVQ